MTELSLDELLTEARRLVQAGNVIAAEVLLRRAAAAEPDSAEAPRLLGTLLAMRGRLLEAEDELRRAIHLDPGAPDAHGNLGNLLREAGRLPEAEAALREALRLRPDYADASNNLGATLRALGRDGEALPWFRAALRALPVHAGAHLNLGRLHLSAGRPSDAVPHLREACRLRPGDADALAAFGTAARRLGHPAEAQRLLRAALARHPGDVGTLLELAGTLAELGQPEPAADLYRAVLRGAPEDASAHLGLGITLATVGRFSEAEASLREVLRLRPDDPLALNSLGAVLRDRGASEEAELALRAALQLRPEYPEARTNLSFLLLESGRFQEGWEAHEARWDAAPLVRERRSFQQPLWGGEALEGRTVLLHAEQGMGDTLQFCRYAPLLATRDARVILEVQAPLGTLLTSLSGIERVMLRGEALPPFDLHLPLMSLPYRLGLVDPCTAVSVPYLTPNPARVATWRAKLAALSPGRRVGLVWSGRPSMAADRRRSLPPAYLNALGDISGLCFISLQKDARSSPGLKMLDPSAELHDFAETAALLMNLDLIVGVDTAVIHLAGALGRPVWMLNRADSCWRWRKGSEDSSWYPTLRQFRQGAPGDWDGVMARLRRALEAWVASPPSE